MLRKRKTKNDVGLEQILQEEGNIYVLEQADKLYDIIESKINGKVHEIESQIVVLRSWQRKMFSFAKLSPSSCPNAGRLLLFLI